MRYARGGVLPSSLRDAQRKKCCKKCRQVKFKDTMTKRSVQKQAAQNTQNNKTKQTFRINYFCVLGQTKINK